MIKALTFTAITSGLSMGAAHAELEPKTVAPLSVPSGQPVAFYESIMDRPAMGLTARFRFIAPELPKMLESLSYEELETDMAYLCVTYALPRIAVPAPRPSMIVISMAEREMQFGSSEPDIAQVFEAYRPQGNTCEWEAF